MEKSSSLKTIVLWCCRLLLGGTFIYAATLKIMDPPAFVADIGHYRLLPYPLALIMGVYLPWLELVCGSAVLIRRLERGALLLLVGLCGLFAVALATAWFRGLDINCGCFGHDATANLPLAFIRSFCLAGLGIILLRSTGREPVKAKLAPENTRPFSNT